MASRKWTPEQRQQQAERIKAWSPWQHSTGPRTDEGKAASSRNAWKGGYRQMLRDLCRALRQQRDRLREL